MRIEKFLFVLTLATASGLAVGAELPGRDEYAYRFPLQTGDGSEFFAVDLPLEFYPFLTPNCATRACTTPAVSRFRGCSSRLKQKKKGLNSTYRLALCRFTVKSPHIRTSYDFFCSVMPREPGSNWILKQRQTRKQEENSLPISSTPGISNTRWRLWSSIGIKRHQDLSRQ